MISELDDSIVAGILEDVPDALVIVDARGVIVRTNGAVERVLGYSPEELDGAPLSMLIPENFRPRHEHHMDRFAQRPSSRPMGVGLELRAQRRDGSQIPVEVALVPLRSDPALTAAFVRDVSLRRRLIDRLIADNDVITATAAGSGRDEMLAIGARRAAHLLHADGSWVVLLDRETGMIDAVISGEGDSTVVTTSPAARTPLPSLTAGVTTGDDARAVAAAIGANDADIGDCLIARFGEQTHGALVVTRLPGEVPFDGTDCEVAHQFSAVIATALELIEARAAADRVSLMVEHERIARDLHDTVIQTVFAEGLRLEATSQLADGPVADRIRQSVDTLDGVIREIRAAIFQLQNARRDTGGLRADVLATTDEVTQAAGVRARVAFGGSVEALTPRGVGDVLLIVLREALTNVVRHADATSVDVVVDVDEDARHVALTVVDDGVGPADHPSAGLGLVSMQARALELGGSFTIRPAAKGTVVRWSAPIT